MGVYLKILPGVKVRVSKRGLRPSLPIDSPEHIGPYFDALAAKAYKVAAAKRTKPLQR
jgi:hypothetical protein